MVEAVSKLKLREKKVRIPEQRSVSVDQFEEIYWRDLDPQNNSDSALIISCPEKEEVRKLIMPRHKKKERERGEKRNQEKKKKEYVAAQISCQCEPTLGSS